MKNYIYKESFINNTNLKYNKPIELLDELINMLNKFITTNDFTGDDEDDTSAPFPTFGANVHASRDEQGTGVGAQGNGTAIKKSDLHETAKMASINTVKKLAHNKIEFNGKIYIEEKDAPELIKILENTTQADLSEILDNAEFIEALKEEYTNDHINSLKTFDKTIPSYANLWGIKDKLRTCAISTGIDRLAQKCNENA